MQKLSLQVEPWSDALPELRPFFSLLWEDVAIDKDRFTAKCDEEKYAALEKVGILHLVTMRNGDELAGYFLMFVTPNAHYSGAGLMAFTDMYYLRRKYRTATSGLRLFSYMEQTLKEKGVVKAYSSHKILNDNSALFTALGWTASDIVYSKVLA